MKSATTVGEEQHRSRTSAYRDACCGQRCLDVAAVRVKRVRVRETVVRLQRRQRLCRLLLLLLLRLRIVHRVRRLRLRLSLRVRERRLLLLRERHQIRRARADVHAAGAAHCSVMLPAAVAAVAVRHDVRGQLLAFERLHRRVQIVQMRRGRARVVFRRRARAHAMRLLLSLRRVLPS